MTKKIGALSFEAQLAEYLKIVVPAGSVQAFAGTTPPTDWLICDGRAVSRTVYADLFAAIGIAHGQGDGSATFNLPDYRGQFLRGRVNISTVTGSGTAASNQATFTSHGINRTGFRVRLSSGTLSGLATSTDYFAIVVDANTLAFASSQANALADTRIAISGANSAVITQWEDPDASSRIAPNVGGNSGNAVGSVQSEANLAHRHHTFVDGRVVISDPSSLTGSNYPADEGVNGVFTTNYIMGGSTSQPTTGLNSSVGGNESRPKNSLINYIIKI